MSEIHRVSRLGAFLALISFLVMACTGGGADRAPATGGAPTSGGPQEPKMRRLVISVAEPGTESNSPRILTQTVTWQLRPMYEHLIGIDPATGRFVPQLATEWSLEPDGKSYRFKLRKGVQFHGGRGEMTAKDVVHTWEDAKKDDATDIKSVVQRNFVESVEAVNDYEVVFRMTAPRVDFLPIASEVQGGIQVMSKAHFDAAGEPTLQSAPIAGTGPYQFRERAQGSYIRFDRVSFPHWRVTPDFPEFEYRFQNESSSRLAGLLAGETQITNLPSDLLPQATAQGFKLIKGRVRALRTFGSFQCCFINSQTAEYPVFANSPLMDPRVRRALNKAINRDELNRAFFANKGETLYLSHHDPIREGWDPTWQSRFPEEYGYDQARARALLAEGGQPNLRTTFIVRPLPMYSGAEDVAEAIAGYWRAVGVDVQLQTIDAAEISAGQRNLRYDNHVLLTGTSAEQFVGFNVYNSSTAGLYLGAQHPDIQSIVRQISVELTEDRRADLYKQGGNRMYDLHLDIPLFWLPAEAVADPKVIADWEFPGSISGTWTHPEGVKAVK